MVYYKIAGIPYSSELYHHGIKGQKWGIRRYQNADGTLTAAGKERYGTDSLPTNSHSTLRRFLTREYGVLSSAYRGKQRREDRLLNKINKNKSKGKNTEKLERSYNAQKQRNIDYEKYTAKASTEKLIAQALLLGGTRSAQKYREARASGADRLLAYMTSSVATIPLRVLEKFYEKDRYGAFVHSDNSSSNYLEHFGILGQEHIRNGCD